MRARGSSCLLWTGSIGSTFFSNAKMSKMSPTRWLEHVVKDTPVNSPLSSSRSSIVFLLIVFVVTLRFYVWARCFRGRRREFEKGVYYEGIYGIVERIVIWNYIFPSLLFKKTFHFFFFHVLATEFLMSLLFGKNNHVALISFWNYIRNNYY